MKVKRLRQRHTFPGFTQVSSALVGLTSLFGMGRGGPHRYSHHKDLKVLYRIDIELKENIKR